MPNRFYNGSDYRYGFQGQEKDNELKGDGNSYDFGARMYDPRIGRWFSPDAFEHETPSWTPYRFAFNNPIFWIDSDGNREFPSYNAYVTFAKANKIKVLSHQEMWKQGHWTYQDRQGKTSGSYGGLSYNGPRNVFKNAAIINTNRSGSGEYITLPEREDYYKVMSDYYQANGYEIKWMEAAYTTVGTLDLALRGGKLVNWFHGGMGSNDDINDFIRAGNKAILDDMMPKIRALAKQKPLKGEDAKAWDAQALSDEQNLIQPYYEALKEKNPKNIRILQKNLEYKYEQWQGDVMNSDDRWVFGMKLMGYQVSAEDRPEPTNTKQ